MKQNCPPCHSGTSDTLQFTKGNYMKIRFYVRKISNENNYTGKIRNSVKRCNQISNGNV
jgi:hypothetical protein